jgi:hypothetical protein
MGKESELPVNLSVEIKAEDLKRVVEEGRLMEFVDAFSGLAGEAIRGYIMDHLAKAGVGLAEVGEGFSISVGFDVDDPFITGPFPRPPFPHPQPSPIPYPWARRSWVAIDTVPLPERPTEEWLRNIVREEIARMG